MCWAPRVYTADPCNTLTELPRPDFGGAQKSPRTHGPRDEHAERGGGRDRLAELETAAREQRVELLARALEGAVLHKHVQVEELPARIGVRRPYDALDDQERRLCRHRLATVPQDGDG